MNSSSWLNRLIEAAVGLLVAALALNWAWQLLRPLVPLLAITIILLFVVPSALRRWRGW